MAPCKKFIKQNIASSVFFSKSPASATLTFLDFFKKKFQSHAFNNKLQKTLIIYKLSS